MLNWGDHKEGIRHGRNEAYWALVLEPNLVQAGVWEVEAQSAKVLAVSSPAVWETQDELVGAVDAVLSSSLQGLADETTEPSKVVFGVPPSWVKEGQISDEYLPKIKKICTELSLEPTGFVVLSEAIAHLVKAEEGTPLNAVVVGMGKDYLEISVFKLGNLLGNTQVTRSVSVFEDVVEGLSRFSGTENLPSRIIIYDGREGELEEVKENLTSADWQGLTKVKFLHTPKVEILPADKKITATSLAGGAEMAGVTNVEALKKESEMVEVTKEVAPEHQNLESPQNNLSAQELGFVVGEDVAVKNSFVKTDEPVFQTRPVIQAPPVPTSPPLAAKPFKFTLPPVNFGFLGKLKTFMSKKMLAVAIAVLVVLLALVVLWWVTPKAIVKLYVNPKEFSEKAEVTLDSKTQSLNLETMTLPAKVLSTQVSGEKTQSTTGTKKVGDKAKGTVLIQNGTAAILNLPAGTAITSGNNLVFDTVKSASVSAALSPANPGTASVDVVAVDIGAEYNLAKDEVFKVGNLPKAEVDAVATSNLTGGSSREISAVSESDAKKLLDSLSTELTDNANSDLLGKLDEAAVLVTESVVATPSAKTYSAKVGDEASNLKLNLTLKVNGLTVSKADLNQISDKILKGSTPTGFSLGADGVDYAFSALKSGTTTSTKYNLNLTANYLPQVDKRF